MREIDTLFLGAYLIMSHETLVKKVLRFYINATMVLPFINHVKDLL
jgi:hypothetical protein